MAIKESTRKLAVSGMMAALMIVLGTTPLGFIPIGPFDITIMHLPVIIGAILEGPVVGGVLGLFFGLFSIYQAMVAPGVLSPLFFDPLVSVVPRVLVGLCAWYVYAGMERLLRPRRAKAGQTKPEGRGVHRLVWNIRQGSESLSVAVASLLATLCNTVLVLGSIYVFHAAAYAEAMEVSRAVVVTTLLSTAVVNGVPESIVALVIATAVILAVKKIKIPRKGVA